ncbi:MAG: hypothetical protein M1608_01110 [Candidatus Omnitrophica bacterium]|nr:hypothetical protein [Candidatus Omnitrophota bacterium]
MKNNNEAKKEQTAKDQATQAKTPKAKREPAEKAVKVTKANSGDEIADRLPGNIEELKATKGGLVSFLFLSGKNKEEIAKDLQGAFKLTDAQAVKIVRRITGRARFFRRVFELMVAK